MLAIESAFPQFMDIDGTPINNGQLYFGVVNLNPETNPITVYWDAAGTQPAAQPIQTINGYAVRNGSPASIFVNSDYSLNVRNGRGNLVFYAPTSKNPVIDGSVPTAANTVKTVDAINAVDATNLSDGVVLIARGRSAAGDGGGGTFRYVSASAQAADGVTVFAPTAGTGRLFRDGWTSGKFDRPVSVRWAGAKGDGTTNDLAALQSARDAASTLGATLFFPDGAYGISDRFMFADGGNAEFSPGAYIKLLGSTASGGAVSGPFPTQTKRIEVINLQIDCNNIAGENGVGFGHKIGAKLVNLKVRNVLHSSTIFGGKALQFEGAEATNVQVLGLNLENCSVGIDIGAVATEQTVNVTISDVHMNDVDIPVHVNDTNTTTPSDNYDQIEILIDGLHCRNCGKLTYTGATATGGGIIVSDRGFKVTINDLQVVNDRGGFTSTAYGVIGALVRGQGKGIVINNALVDADMVALFDFNPALFQSPFAGDLASYVLADNIRHYGNLDFIVKCLPGGNKMGPGMMRGVEIGGTLATLAGIVDTNAAAYSNTHLEVINRDNNFFSSGLQPLSKLNALGNTLSGNTQGYQAPAQMQGSWTPIDASGASLVFSASEGWWFRQGDMVVAMGQVTYPATANGSNAKIGGLPFTVKNNLYARAGGALTISTIAGVERIYPEQNTTQFPLLNATSASVTNATCSGGIFAFVITYPAA